jgi:Protein of unknown function (DUF3073)
MGRGRAKAKQTKVARELKYSSQGTDLDALRAELAGERRTSDSADSSATDDDELEDDEDAYSDYVYDDEDDEDEATGR